MTIHHWTTVRAVAARLRFDMRCGVVVFDRLHFTSLPTTLDEDMSLQCVFPREALVTVVAWKGLHRKVNSLMSLQIVVAVKALRTLIALEGSISGSCLHWLWRLTAIHRLRICCETAVVAWWNHPLLHATDHGYLSVGAVDVCHDGSWHRWQRVGWVGRTDEVILIVLMTTRMLA